MTSQERYEEQMKKEEKLAKEMGYGADGFDTQEHREKAQKMAREILEKVGTPQKSIKQALIADEVTWGIIRDPDDFLQWIKKARVDTTTAAFPCDLGVIFVD